MTLTHNPPNALSVAAHPEPSHRRARVALRRVETPSDPAESFKGVGASPARDDDVSIDVVDGLGWPSPRPTSGFSRTVRKAGGLRTGMVAGLGWPTDGPVSRETRPAPAVRLPRERDDSSVDIVSRGTGPAEAGPLYPGAAPIAVQVVSRGTVTPSDVVDEHPAVPLPASPVEAPDAPHVDSLPAPSVATVLSDREAHQHGDTLPRPARTRVMVVANQKGGVGKTTSTVNLAAALAQGGLRVLVIDLDPQGNASTALAIDHHRGVSSIYDALVDGVPLVDVVTPSPHIDGLFVVPATIDLAGAEIELVSMVAREGRLRRAVHAHPLVFGAGADRFDYVLIDCPPSLGLLTLNALVAADEMMIPIQAEYYALEGLGQLLETVEMVREHLNPDLAVSTIVLTMYDARTRLAAGVADEVRTHFPRQVLRTAIPRSVRVSEAPSYGQTVITYDPGSPGALSYLEAAREVALAVMDRRPAEDSRVGEVRA